MKITVRLFAIARDAAENGTLELELTEGATIGTVRRELVARLPELAAMSTALRFAVNEDYAHDDTVVQASDEVACIPPVSGG